MKTKLMAAIIPVAGACFVSCSSSNDSGSYMEDVDYIQVQADGSDRISFWSPKSGIVAENSMKIWGTSVVDGVFTSTDFHTYELNTFDGKSIRSIPGCDNLESAGTCVDGLIPVVKQYGRISVIDKQGDTKFVLGPVNGNEIIISSPAYCDGLLRVKDNNDKVGYINKSGEVAISLVYTDGSDFNEGYAAVSTTADNGMAMWHVIDKSGIVVADIPAGLSVNSKCIGGRFLCYNSENLPVFVDINGTTTTLPENIIVVSNFNKEVYMATDVNLGYQGVFDFQGDMIVPCEYYLLSLKNDGGYVGVKDNTLFFFDAKGNVKKQVPEVYHMEYLGHFGTRANLTSGSAKMYDSEGKELTDAQFQTVSTTVDYGNLWSKYFDREGFENLMSYLVHRKAIGNRPFGGSNDDLFNRPATEADTETQLYTVKNAYPESGFDVTITYCFLGKLAKPDGKGGYEWNKTNYLDGAEILVPVSCYMTPDFLRELTRTLSKMSNQKLTDMYHFDMLKRTTPYGGGYELLSLGIAGQPHYRAYPEHGILQVIVGNSVQELSDKYNRYVLNRPVVIPDVNTIYNNSNHSDMGAFSMVKYDEYDCGDDEFIPDDYDFGAMND